MIKAGAVAVGVGGSLTGGAEKGNLQLVTDTAKQFVEKIKLARGKSLFGCNLAPAQPTAMKLWKTDDELFATIRRELFTCVVGDVMDKLELQHQFLPPQIRPLRSDMVAVGRALPVLAVDVFAEKVAGSANQLMAKPFGLMLEALMIFVPTRSTSIPDRLRATRSGEN